jgi:hypothetical protein
MKFPEQYRVRRGQFASNPGDPFGMFMVAPALRRTESIKIIATDGLDQKSRLERWEHVSVSLASRCPTWQEMCFVKSLFWDDEDCVMQLHPPRSQWINNHPYCLHLWRPLERAIPLPPPITVGLAGLQPHQIGVLAEFEPPSCL